MAPLANNPPAESGSNYTPSGYQRTTGGQFRWSVPTVDELQRFFPQYEILGLQGQGGMGAVFRAHQKSLGRLVAIKVLPVGIGEDNFNFAERFKNEARTMARMDHPNIVHVHDFGELASGLLYFIMEFIEGSDVQQLISAQGVLTPAYAIPITQHVCDALAYAHSQGVIHRDIKPANIMLTKDGRVKVADFGLARLDDPTQPGLTQTGMALGTPDYVAPEALSPDSTVDSRADLYAIGVMLCHMLTGEVPRGMFELPSQRNAALDPRIDGVITKAMKQRPDDRYQTAAAIRADLDTILTQPLPSSVPTSDMPKAERAPATMQELESLPARRKVPFHWMVLGGLGVVVAGVAMLLAFSSSPKPQALLTAIAADTPALTAAQPESTTPLLDPTKWLPFTYPGDFGKIDGGVEALEDGGVTVEGSFGKRLRATWTHEDLAVRSRITLPPEGVGIIGLRTDLNKAAVRAVVHPDRIEIVSEIREDADATDQTILQTFAGISGPFYEKKGAELAFAVLGNEYRLWLGEKLLGTVTDTTASGGKVLFDGVNATFHDMQWQVIGDITPSLKPTEPEPAPVVIPGVWTPVRFPNDKPPKGEWRENTLHLPIREDCPLPMRYAARDAAIRAKISTASGDGSFKGIYFKLRNDNALGFFNLTDPRAAHVGVQPDQTKDTIPLNGSARDTFPLGKQDLLVEFAAVGDDLILAIEGKVVAKAHSNIQAVGKRAEPPFKALIKAGWNTARLKDLEFISLDGISKDKHPGFIRAALSAPQPAAPKTAPVVAKPPVPSVPQPPSELKALMEEYAASITTRVTAPHDSSLAQLNTGFTAALDRAVASQQLPASAILADKQAIASKQPLPPDTDTTPDALKTYRATYRAKASEIDDTRTTAHLGLLTPYVAKLRVLETTLTKAGRATDAEAVKAYRDALSENPLALPGTKP